ncbi:MAG: porin [bacterium]
MWHRIWIFTALPAFWAALAFFLIAPGAAKAQSPDSIAELRHLIERQQTQIEVQAKTIKALKNRVDALATSFTKEKVSAKAAPPPGGLVKSGGKATVKLYGQVNRGVLYADDGKDQEYFHVDNDNSSTRIGLLATAKASEDLSIGAKVEVEFESNASSAVSQTSGRSVGSNSFKERHLDVFLHSKALGKLSVGQGDTASNGTSEVDLSGTSVIGYSDVDDIAGGMFFVTRAGDLTSTKISSVYTNMDGLSRDDRLRYDTPKFAGFSLAGSVIADGATDAAIRYSGKFPYFKLAAAFGYANQAGLSTSIEDQIGGSVSLLLDSGLNFTFAAGRRELEGSSRNDPDFIYFKVGFLRKFFSIGPTALAVDFGSYEDIAQNGDEADTLGFLLVQNLSDWGAQLYFGYRNYDFNRRDISLRDIDAVLAGVRVKF